MAGRGRHGADELLALRIAMGDTIQAAAEQCGIGERTVHRRLNDPEFTALVAHHRGRMVDSAVGIVSNSMTKAIETLVDLLTPTTRESVRCTAAKAILQLGIEVREHGEFEARLANVEQRSRTKPALKVAT